MRFSLKFAIAMVVVWVGIEMVAGQQPGGVLGGLGGILGGGKQQQNIESLLNNAGVKKELKLTDEQLAKVPAAVLEALAKVLDAEQLKRFKQIELQNRGYQVFGDPSVQEALQLTEAQKGDIKTVIADAEKETQKATGDLTGKGGGIAGGLQGVQGKIQTIAKDAKEQCLATLTASQKRTWNEMLGDEFKLEQMGGIGGFDLNNLDLKGIDIQGIIKGLKKKGGG